MAKFTFTGPVSAVYIDLGLEAEPGQTYDLDTAPDGWWTTDSAKAPQSAPEADSAPSDATPASTPTDK